MKQLQDARKQRSFEEQERDMIFRKLEIARAEMTKEEAEKFTTLRTIEQNRMIEQAELKVTLGFSVFCMEDRFVMLVNRTDFVISQ